jgi:SUN domain-containing protein 1/2
MWNFAKFALKWIGSLAVIISICYLGWRFNPNREISNVDSVQYDQAHSHQVAVLENRVRSLTEQIKKTEKGMVTRDEFDHVNQLVTRGEKAIDRDHKNYDQVEKEIREMKSSIRTLRSEMTSLQDTFGPGQQELVKELKRVEMMMKDHKMDVRENMGEMKERIEKVEKEMIKMFDEKTWKDGLKRVLPEMVPFKYGRNGKVEMDPSFWSEMKVLFAEQSRSNEKIVQAEKPTWRDFVDENDEKLEKWLSDSLGRRSVYSNTVTQDRFQKMLQEEITVIKRSLKQDMERRAAEGDMEVKAQLEKMKEETSRVVKNERGNVIVSEGGEEMTFAVNQLIDHALLRYSKDTIAKADYALASAGAGIVHEQTTPSATLARTGLMGALGFRGRSRDPRVALNGRNEPGFCWSFAGSQGTLGIGLSTTVAVEDITMEHVARELVPEKMLSSAAKDVEVVSHVTLTLIRQGEFS